MVQRSSTSACHAEDRGFKSHQARQMKRILFVCKGNVARSQIAEALLRKYKPNYQVFSAGIQPDTPNRYQHPVNEVIQVMKEEDIDVSQAIVKTITNIDIDKANQIVIMCHKNDCPSILINSNKNIYWKINDPYNSDISNFRNIREQIKKLILNTF